ncbi:P-loop NTPase fold protein [Paenibacillus sp. R14(2021)]|uniref:P-loop NTPase fold protein n=1 Tax=Paenibacillus sp. R14(2021) TaxID=2859228 RepID=UPI001C612E2D|nr:P-loop NTPase fold protein [Paenibacillus sp. R14(2021)]
MHIFIDLLTIFKDWVGRGLLYFGEHPWVLFLSMLCLTILFFWVTICGIRCFNINISPVFEFKLPSAIKSFFYIAIALGLGWAFSRWGQNPDNEKLVKSLLFIINTMIIPLLSLIGLVLIKDIFIYYKTKSKSFKHGIKLVSFLGLLLLIKLVLEHNPFIIILNWSILVFLSNLFSEIKRKKKTNEFLDDPEKLKLILETDEEVRHSELLFPTRKKELVRIKHHIREIKYNEPFAIVINAPWGEGKSSLLNVLLEELKSEGTKSIFIKPLIWDTREKLSQYFFSQLEKMLLENGVFTGKGSPYKEYINQFVALTDNKKFSKLAEFFDVIPKEKKEEYRELKGNLEIDIQQMLGKKGRLIIVIDDFDRVEESAMRETLVFIKEVVDFKQCAVIFSMHYGYLKEKKINNSYLDKFIGQHFYLKKISHLEMLGFFNEKHLLINSNWSSSDIVLHGTKLESEIVGMLETITDYLSNQLEKKENELQVNLRNTANNGTRERQLQDEKLQLQDDIKLLKDDIQAFYNNMNNPRKIKRMYRAIKEIFDYLDNIYRDNNGGSLADNWNTVKLYKIAFTAGFLKSIFELEYREMLESGDLKQYANKVNSPLIKYVLHDVSRKYLREIEQYQQEMMLNIYNEIIFQMDNEMILQELKPTSLRFVEKLDRDEPIDIDEKEAIEQISNYIYAIKMQQWGEGNSTKTKSRLIKLTEVLFKSCDEGKLRLQDTIGWLDRHYIGGEFLSWDIGYLEKLEERLDSAIVFKNNAEKNLALNKLTLDIEINLPFLDDISRVAWLYRYQQKGRWENIRASYKDLYSLKDINDMLHEYIGEELVAANNISSDIEIDKFNKSISFMLNQAEQSLSENVLKEAIDYCKCRLSILTKLHKLINKIGKKIMEVNALDGAERDPEVRSVDDAQRELEKMLIFIESGIELNNNIYLRFGYLLSSLEYLSRTISIDIDILKTVKTVLHFLDRKWSADLLPEGDWVHFRMKWIEVQRNLEIEIE